MAKLQITTFPHCVVLVPEILYINQKFGMTRVDHSMEDRMTGGNDVHYQSLYRSRCGGNMKKSIVLSQVFFLAISACGGGNGIDEHIVGESNSDTIEFEKTGKAIQKGVYGVDSRKEVYASPAFLEERARQSIVTMMSVGALFLDEDEQVVVNAPRFGQTDQYCSTVPFQEQLTGGDCSGTLIDDDLVLTAGHCVTSLNACRSSAFVFDYFLKQPGEMETIEIEDVYICSEIIVQSGGFGGADDYAIVRLDRPVDARRQPAKINRSKTSVRTGQSISMIGSPSGLPLKVENDGKVQRAASQSQGTFEAYIDAFGGNSGSGVFDQDGDVIGILVAGASDFDFRGRCVDVARFSETGFTSETITFAELAFADACGRGLQSENICGRSESPGEENNETPDEPEEENNEIPDESELCVNTCRYANDGVCDDGRPGAPFAVCALGTDCGDCGSVAIEDSPVEIDETTEVCSNTCQYANDGECDDGGPGAEYNACAFGSDCGDCGVRS